MLPSDQLESGSESSAGSSGSRTWREDSNGRVAGSCWILAVPGTGGAAAGRPGRMPAVDSRTCDSESWNRRGSDRWPRFFAVGHSAITGGDGRASGCGAFSDHGHDRSTTRRPGSSLGGNHPMVGAITGVVMFPGRVGRQSVPTRISRLADSFMPGTDASGDRDGCRPPSGRRGSPPGLGSPGFGWWRRPDREGQHLHFKPGDHWSCRHQSNPNPRSRSLLRCR